MNLALRVGSAAVLLAIVAAALTIGGLFLDGMIAIAIVVSAVEVGGIAKRLGPAPLWWLLIPTGVVFGLHLVFRSDLATAVELVTAIVVAVGLAITVLRHNIAPVWTTSVGLGVYVGMLGYFLGLFGWSAVNHEGVKLVCIALGGAILTDTGAYFVGMAIGKHKLAPRISPSKTVEGAVGGAALCVIATALIAPHIVAVSAFQASLLGMLMAVAAQLGDLAESKLKRAAHVKDSGTLIPGHGGLLDRVDSLLFVAPVVYCYLKMIALP